MDRFSSYLHRADLDLDRPSNIPSRGNQQRSFNVTSNPHTSFNQDGIPQYRRPLESLLPSIQLKSNSQKPPQLPQPIGPKQSQPPAPANGIQQWSFNPRNIQQRPSNPWNIQQRPSKESNNLNSPQQAQPQPEQKPTEPKQSPSPAPASSQAKEYLIITYKESHALVAKKPTLAELKQAAAEIFDIILDHHKHLYAFVYHKGLDVAADAPAATVELEIHESAYFSLKDGDHVFFAHRQREPERPDGEAGRRRQEGVLTGGDGSSERTSGGPSERWMRLAPTVEYVANKGQQGRGYGCGNSLNGTGQHAASHSMSGRQQVFGGGGSNLQNGAVSHHFESQFPSSSSSPWWSTAVELGSHLNCGTCRQNTASRSGAGGQQQHEPVPVHGSDESNVNGVGAGNNPQPEISSSSTAFIAPVEVNTCSLIPTQKGPRAQVSRELWLVLGCQCGYWKWEDYPYPGVLSYKRSWEASWRRTL